MKFCKKCNWDWPDLAEECSVCGSREFIDAADVPPSHAPKPPRACCPNPDCLNLVVFTGDDFCSKCGTRLVPVTLTVWEEKIARPALRRNLVSVLFDPSTIFGTAAKMGFLPGEAEASLDQLFVNLSGAGRQRLNLWVQENVLTLQAEQRNTEDVRRQALEQAEHVGIYPAFAQTILNTLVPEEPSVPETMAETVGDSATQADDTGIRSLGADAGAVKAEAGGDGESAAAAYAVFLRRDSVMPDPIFLSAVNGGSITDMLGAKPVVLEANPHGALVLFRGGEDDENGWVYPNPRLHFREEALRKVFPSLKEEQFYLLNETESSDGSGVEPVPVIKLDASRWQVADVKKIVAARSHDDSTGVEAEAVADKPGTTVPDITDTDESNARRRRTRRRLLVAACVAVIVVAAGWRLTRDTPEDGLERAVAVGNLLKPPGESAYDYYQQLKSQGGVPESLKKKLLAGLFSASQKTLDEAYRPGAREPSEADWKESLAHLAWASELNPDDASLGAKVEYCKGQVARLSGDTDAAVKSWVRAALLDAKWALPGKSLALAYQAQGNFTLGRAYVLQAIERDPGWAVPYAIMGDWFWQVAKDSAAAESFYRKAAERSPLWAYPHALLAEAAMRRRNYDVAARELQLALSPDAIGADAVDLEKLKRNLKLATRQQGGR
jgi:hypothetical protein